MPFLARFTRYVLVALVAIVLCAVLAAGPSWVQTQALETRPVTEAHFRDWLTRTVWPEARKHGVSPDTFERSLVGMTLDWDLPELEPPGLATPPEDQWQAEFQRPEHYFAEDRSPPWQRWGRAS